MRVRKKGAFIVACVVVCLGLVYFFLLLARQIQGETSLTRFDTELGEKLGVNREAVPFFRSVLMAFTLLGSEETLIILVPLGGVIFWVKKQRTVAVVWILCGLGAGVLNANLKKHYDRPRPPFKDAWVYENNQSFPSGHSSGSMAIFGMLGYLMVRSARRWQTRLLSLIGAALLIGAIGFSRMYLGAHYFSDVMGGFLVGAAWLTVCVLLLESLRRGTVAPPAR